MGRGTRDTPGRAQLLADLERLQTENQRLKARLDEDEQTLAAIRTGDVDAIVVTGPEGERVFTLSGAETVYRLVFETMAEAALSVGADGRILFCNPRFAELVGEPMERLLGRRLTDWVSPGEREDFEALLRRCEWQPVRQRVVFRTADDTLKAVHLTGHALEQPGGSSLCLVATDLTELESSARHIQLLREHQRVLEARQAELRTARREAERAAAALAESEERLRFALESTRIGAWELDLADLSVQRSPQHDRIFGYDEPLPRWTYGIFLEHVLPEDRASMEANFREAHAALGEWNVEFRIRRADGEVRWLWASGRCRLDADGHPRRITGLTQDITERKRDEAWLRLTAQVFSTTLEGILITDRDRNIIEVNAAFTRITGYAREEVLGRNPRFMQSGRHDRDFYAAMWRAIRESGHWTGEIWNRRKDGGIYPELITISAIADERGEVTHYVSISSDITLLKEHEKRLEQIAHYDALTGIPNRMLLYDRIKQALGRTRREHKLLAVCYLDLDGFKPINDTLGHEAGDGVLIEVARRIGQVLRGGDTVARLGGDEFVVLMLGIESPVECRMGLDRLLQAIAQPIFIQGQQCGVTASIGATLYPSDNGDADTLLRHADQAMYLAKQSGKNRYHVFDPHQDERIRSHQERKARVEQGLLDREFELFYQPKVEMRSHRIAGVEALIRWRHPERGVLTPGEFLPAIQNSDLEIQIGEWVIDTALAQLAQWRGEGLDLDLSVNIAAAHLQSEGFADTLRQRLALHPALRPGQLQIEILETAALEDLPAAQSVIKDCVALGVGLALDDFGTGYSSLSYLRMIPADTLKIDQSFVRDMLVDKGDYSIVQGVIAMAHAFGRATVAEGVETQGHFLALEEMGCNVGQGYGIAGPMPPGELAQWCRGFAPGLSIPPQTGGMH